MTNLEILQNTLRDFRKAGESYEVTAKEYHFPSITCLKEYTAIAQTCPVTEVELESKIRAFGIEGSVKASTIGPLLTRYEISLDPGTRLSQVRTRSEDLAVALMSDKVRILAPIPGTPLIGVEIANDHASTIGFKDVLKACRKQDHVLPIALGTDTTGEPVSLDLADMPHLLIAGQTGSGKSVFLNVLILSLIYTKTPDEVQLILVDPKRVEMTPYRDIPHLKVPIVVDPDKALNIFRSLVSEMASRYRTLEQHGVRNIVGYNRLEGVKKMPYIVTVVDEMADLMMTAGKELEVNIVRLAQLARAVGIHLVLATQKPVVKVITGLIKSNMTSRISFQVASKSDSRVILDCNGAEKLAGRGDMLAVYPGVSEPVRLHGAWVSDSEIQKIVNFIQ